jgi:thiol-disulfide isomerase/thioredoxin
MLAAVSKSFLRPVLCGLLLAITAPTQKLKVGDPAPPLAAAAWLHWTGDAPSLGALAGKAVLLEFWGTWCGPCVRAMPAIQKLHDRYRERGLCVLAITYETAATVEPFLKQNAYTLPIGTDTEKRMVEAYGVRSWPTTILIDQEGKIAHVGSPYDIDPALERVLGLPQGPKALLDAWLASAGGDKKAQRQALEALADGGSADFDLGGWARSHLPAEAAQPGDAPAATPAAPAESAPKLGDAADALHKLAKGWSGAQRQSQLAAFAVGAPGPFDLGEFARASLGKLFPLEADELKKLLQDKSYGTALQAIAARPPAAAVLATAAKHDGLTTYCRDKAKDTREMAKKALMAKLWLFEGAGIRDEKLNEKFFGELSVSGFATSPDQKRIIGITLGGAMVMANKVDAYLRDQLAQSLLMQDLGKGKQPKAADIGKQIAAAQKEIVADLEGRYGPPTKPTK